MIIHQNDSDIAAHRSPSAPATDTTSHSQRHKPCLTLKGFLATTMVCASEFEWLAEGKTAQQCHALKNALARWQQAGFPDLGELPVPISPSRLFDLSYSRLMDVLGKINTHPNP
jgi:hypothetical protein